MGSYLHSWLSSFFQLLLGILNMGDFCSKILIFCGYKPRRVLFFCRTTIVGLRWAISLLLADSAMISSFILSVNISMNICVLVDLWWRIAHFSVEKMFLLISEV